MALQRSRPKPIERQRLLGNPGKRPLPKGLTVIQPAVIDVIDPPTTGHELIAAILESQASAWIAQSDRLVLLELLAAGWDERETLRADIAGHGYGDGRYARPAVGRLDRVERNLTTWLSLLGLTPVDRSRLGVAEVKVRSKLEALRDRRASRSRAG